MPDENGTEATRSDAPSAEDSLFGDAAAGKQAAPVEGEDANGNDEQDPQGSDDAAAEAPQEAQDSGNAEEPADAEAQATVDDPAPSADDLKVVLSIKGGQATIGVQRPSSDPHIETFDDLDESGLSQEVSAVVERAKARWEDAPKHPAHERPTPPARRRNRREQGAAQAGAAEERADQPQPETLRLF